MTSCVDHCLLVGRTDFLFGCLYEYFSADSVAKATYLECLEPYILNDTLTSVTPVVMKDFIEHYEGRGSVVAVEACITHMDIASLDIHQVREMSVVCSKRYYVHKTCSQENHKGRTSHYVNVRHLCFRHQHFL